MKKLFIIFMLLFTYLVSFGYQCTGNLEEDIKLYSIICDRITLFAENANVAQSLGYKADAVEQYKLAMREAIISEQIINHMLTTHKNQLSYDGQESLKRQLEFSQKTRELYQSLISIMR